MDVLITWLVGLWLSLSLSCQAQTFAVPPNETDAAIARVDGDHFVIAPETPSQKLFIMIGGTGSRPDDNRALDQVAAQEGYFVISPDYANTVITTVCRPSADLLCFDHFRREIVLGADESSFVNVNVANSLENRLRRLLELLSARDARWSTFYSRGEIDWSRVTLGGHSQGAGHAAYLSKLHTVARVVMFAGPQDRFATREAPWIDEPGRTPGERYRAFLHEGDPFDVNYQIDLFNKLSGQTNPRRVKPGSLPEDTSAPLVVTDDHDRDPHMAVVSPKYQSVWRYLLH